MTLVILAFVSGVLWLQFRPDLPDPAWLWLLPGCVALAAWQRSLAVPLALAAGFLWAAAFAHLRLTDRIGPEFEGRDLEIVGVVAGLPAIGERGARFEFDVESADAKLPRKILLSWYRSRSLPQPTRRPRCSTEAFMPPSAGASRSGCARRTAISIRTGSTTRRG